MPYKWKPSKSQRKAFAIRMQDPIERDAYQERKEIKAEKRRAGSQFHYASAGGFYVPTAAQHSFALMALGSMRLTTEQAQACEMVAAMYSIQEKCHHDYIHIVNELIRKQL